MLKEAGFELLPSNRVTYITVEFFYNFPSNEDTSALSNQFCVALVYSEYISAQEVQPHLEGSRILHRKNYFFSYLRAQGDIHSFTRRNSGVLEYAFNYTLQVIFFSFQPSVRE